MPAPVTPTQREGLDVSKEAKPGVTHWLTLRVPATFTMSAATTIRAALTDGQWYVAQGTPKGLQRLQWEIVPT